MDITKLLPLLLATQNSGGDQNNNLSKMLPELLKAQTGSQNGLTSMLLNMLTSNFNKQNASCQTTQNNQTEMQKTEINNTQNSQAPGTASTLKNYKNFYAPPEYNNAQIASTQKAEQNTCVQNVYPEQTMPNQNKKNSAESSATCVKTPFGYTRLY